MRISKRKLKNGIQLIIVDLPDATSITAIIFAGVGSRYESKQDAGISHYAEHCLFKGSKQYPSPQALSFGFEQFGAGIDAGTSKEYTYFLAKSLRENALEVMQILADLYVNPLFPEDEILRERKVVLEEIRMYKDNPMDEIVRMFSKHMWKDQPIGRSISGTISSVKSLGKENLENHIQKYFQGNNTQVVVSGNVEENGAALDSLERILSVLPKGRVVTPKRARENLKENKVVCKEDSVEQAHIMLGCYGVNLNDDDKFAAAVGNTILGQGMGSKLYGSLRHEEALAYYINSGNISHTDSGAMYIRAGVDHRRLEKSLIRMKDEINNIINLHFSDEEIHRAKQLLKSALVLELDSSDSLGLYIGHQELLIEKPLTLDEMKLEIDNISKEEISKVFKKKFGGSKLLTMITPKEQNTGRLESILAEIG